MKRLVQTAIVALVPALLALELLAFASTILVPRLYAMPSQEAAVRAIDAPMLAEFARTVRSPTLGWDHVPDWVGPSEDCEGTVHRATYDRRRARTYAGYDADAATVLLVGDSYTHGDEVGDDDTIAAHLHNTHGIMAANLGVGGYSPLQAAMKARERLADYPAARVVVLGLMVENIRRTVNGYVPTLAFTEDPQSVFALRPHMRGEAAHPLAPGALDSLASIQALALAGLADDHWARPPAAFPFSLAMLRALTSNSGTARILAAVNKRRDAQYEADYRNPRLADPLFAVVRDFLAWGSAAGITPVVIFFPQNRHDRTSPAIWIDTYAPRLPAGGTVVNASLDGVDWDRFNRRTDLVCHPSGEGYAAIAAAFADTLRPLLPAAR
jgi:hypothetical protein